MEVEMPDPEEFTRCNEKVEPNRRAHFSLLRGFSVQDQPDFVIPALSCRRKSIEQLLGPLPRPVGNTTSREDVIRTIDDHFEPVEDVEPEMYPTRRATVSAGTTALNPYQKKRTYNLHDWPLGEPQVKNDDEFFELELNIGRFKPEEVSARVVGKELIIHCKPKSMRHPREPVPREIFRCYQLPLNSPPVATDVSILKDDNWLRVAVRNQSSLRSPLGIYTPEMAEVIEEEPIVEEEQEMEEDVRMDD